MRNRSKNPLMGYIAQLMEVLRYSTFRPGECFGRGNPIRAF